MKFGLRYCTGRYLHADRAVEILQAGEEAGFESAWTVEHEDAIRWRHTLETYADL